MRKRERERGGIEKGRKRGGETERERERERELFYAGPDHFIFLHVLLCV